MGLSMSVSQRLQIPSVRNKFNLRQLFWTEPCFKSTCMASVGHALSSFPQSPPLHIVFFSVLSHNEVAWTLKDMP